MHKLNLKTLIVLTLTLLFLLANATIAVAGPIGDEKLIFNLLNTQRRAAGVRPLKWGGRIARVAGGHSREMVADNYFSHLSPTAGSLADRLKNGGLTGWLSAGENLAGAPTADIAFELWLNSPLHKKNMLKNSYDRVGIGIANGGPYGAMFTMDLVEKPVGSTKEVKNLSKRAQKKSAKAAKRRAKRAAKRRARRQ